MIMAASVLDENARKRILFDVVDGIPPSNNEPEEALEFRHQIEVDNQKLEYQAEELGFNNVLFEFQSQG